MAEYSFEYNKQRGYTFSSDFSVKEIFSKLKEGQSYNVICEGFGFHEIKKTNGECWVQIRDRKILFDELAKQTELKEKEQK